MSPHREAPERGKHPEASNIINLHNCSTDTLKTSNSDTQAINDTPPMYGDDPDHTEYRTAYELCRAIRVARGSVDAVEAYPVDLEDQIVGYAEFHGLEVEELLTEFELAWPVSIGEHRNPITTTTERWRRNPEAIKLGGLRRRNLNRAATFISILEESAGGGEFYLSCRKLAEVIGVDHMTASRQLKVLVQRGILEERRLNQRSAIRYKLDRSELSVTENRELKTDRQTDRAKSGTPRELRGAL